MSAKALNLAAELKDELAKRLSGVQDVTMDSDGMPLIRWGSNAAAGQQTALIKVADATVASSSTAIGSTLPGYLGTNVIGQAATNYGSPVVIQVVLETSTIANVSLVTEANALALLGACLIRGTRVELFMSANGNATGPEDIVYSNLKATFEPSLKWKTMSSI
jgi:hypothetical protein